MKVYSILFLSLLLIICFSCQKEEFDSESLKNSLVGQWRQEPSPFDSLVINAEYTFKKDYTFERLDKMVDSSGNFLGLRERTTGNYEIKEGKISMSYLRFFKYENFGAGTYYYGNVESLVSYTPIEPSVFKNIIIKINPDKKSLTLQWPPCPYNVHCVQNYTQLLLKN